MGDINYFVYPRTVQVQYLCKLAITQYKQFQCLYCTHYTDIRCVCSVAVPVYTVIVQASYSTCVVWVSSIIQFLVRRTAQRGHLSLAHEWSYFSIFSVYISVFRAVEQIDRRVQVERDRYCENRVLDGLVECAACYRTGSSVRRIFSLCRYCTETCISLVSDLFVIDIFSILYVLF